MSFRVNPFALPRVSGRAARLGRLGENYRSAGRAAAARPVAAHSWVTGAGYRWELTTSPRPTPPREFSAAECDHGRLNSFFGSCNAILLE